MPFDYTIKASDDPFNWHREVILDAWSLPAEAIKRVQQPKRTAIAKAVRHEVNGARLGASGTASTSCLSRLSHLTGFIRRFQFQFAVDPIDALVAPLVTPQVAQMQKTRAKTQSFRPASAQSAD